MASLIYPTTVGQCTGVAVGTTTIQRAGSLGINRTWNAFVHCYKLHLVTSCDAAIEHWQNWFLEGYGRKVILCDNICLVQAAWHTPVYRRTLA